MYRLVLFKPTVELKLNSFKSHRAPAEGRTHVSLANLRINVLGNQELWANGTEVWASNAHLLSVLANLEKWKHVEAKTQPSLLPATFTLLLTICLSSASA